MNETAIVSYRNRRLYMSVTKIKMSPENRKVRIGVGKYEGRWFARIVLS